MPIDAILFGGRRATVVPLVREAFDWEHGIFLAATMAREMTAAAAGTVGQLRFDPFAQLPFSGYNMGDYFATGSRSARPTAHKLPKIFYVNWFRKDDDGKFLWPGFGENSRVLEWVCRRFDGDVEAVETPIGLVPNVEDLNTEGLNIDPAALEELLRSTPSAVRRNCRRSRSSWPSSATVCRMR